MQGHNYCFEMSAIVGEKTFENHLSTHQSLTKLPARFYVYAVCLFGAIVQNFTLKITLKVMPLHDYWLFLCGRVNHYFGFVACS